MDLNASANPSVLIHGRSVPVSALIPEHEVPRVLSTPPFSTWVSNLGPRFHVRGIELESLNTFGSRVGFVKFKAACSVDGKDAPGIVFARGSAVAILVVLTSQEDGQRWVLCVRQPRVPAGRLLLELVAGMMDGRGNFCGVAAQEMAEEAQLHIHESELVDMTELAFGAGTACGSGGEEAARSDGPALGVYLSAGGCDVRRPATSPARKACSCVAHALSRPLTTRLQETLRILHWSRTLPSAEIEALQGKCTGRADEGEVITLQLVKFEDLWRTCPDAKALCALALYKELQSQGRLP